MATPSITAPDLVRKLYADNVLDELQLISILGEARHNLTLNVLERALVRHSILSAERLAELKAEVSGRPVYTPGQVEISTVLPEAMVKRHGVLLTTKNPPLVLMVEDTPANIEAVSAAANGAAFETALMTVPHFTEMMKSAYHGQVFESHPVAADLFDVLDAALKERATDIHLAVGVPPRVRADGSLKFLDFRPVDLMWMRDQVDKLVEPRHRKDLAEKFSTDLAYSYGTARFRVNIATDAAGPTMALRQLPSKIPTPEEINLPEAVRKFADLERGMVLVTGPTGSGKPLELSTTIPTPTGTTTMGELKVGDWVLGSDGLPCRVTGLSEINETPDLYRVRFSDGQEVLADFDHQWLVATHHGRSVPRTRKRQAAIARHDAAVSDAALLDELAAARPAAESLTAEELFELLAEHGLTGEFVSPFAVRSALEVTDCPSHEETRSRHVSSTVTRTQRATVYPTVEVLAEIATTRSGFADIASELLSSGDHPAEASCQQIADLLGGARHTLALRAVARKGIEGRETTFESTYPIEEVRRLPVRAYPAAVALKSLSVRLSQRFWSAPGQDAQLTRMTTGEMLAAGLRLGTGHANFSVRVARPLDLPEVDLPIDPYVLGAWLGDGATKAAVIASDPAHRDAEGIADKDRMLAQLAAGGYEAHSTARYVISVPGLASQLRSAGVFGDKHIPVAYLRASHDQRLALLQGLMDTDGTVSVDGACELSLSDKRLATDALDLIRSLGIKASASWDRPASYKDADGNVIECKPRHRIKFTTDQPVFRLPRKLERLPSEIRETQRWLYITDITPVTKDDPDYGPARCASVDSPDHTYLCGDGYVVTSNSTTLAAVLYEIISRSPRHVITLEDPIEFSLPRDLTSHVNQRELGASLGTFGDGIRDALRQDPDVVLVGELRDAETVKTALTLAETGHLVLGTLHTYDAPSTIMRMVNSFPAAEQDAVRAQLSQLLRGVVSQTLVPLAAGRGRIAAFELLLNTPAVSTNLRKLDGHNQLKQTMQTAAAEGMATMEMALAMLVHAGKISEREARFRARDEKEFIRYLEFLKKNGNH